MSGLSMRANKTRSPHDEQKTENRVPRFCLEYKNKPLSYLHNHQFEPKMSNSRTRKNAQDFDLIVAMVKGEEFFKTPNSSPQPTNQTICKSYNEEMDNLICSIVEFDCKYPGNTGDHLPPNHPDRMELDRRVATLNSIERLNLEKTHELSRYIDREIQKEANRMESIGIGGEKSVAQCEFENLKRAYLQFGNNELVPMGCVFGSIGEPARRSRPRPAAAGQAKLPTPILPAAMVPMPPRQSPPRYKNGKQKHSMCCSFCYGTHSDQCKAQGVEPLEKDFPGAWSTHPAKENGNVVCPVLYRIRCEICGATAEKAHTTKFHLSHPEQCT